jgi:hypothetical protein
VRGIGTEPSTMDQVVVSSPINTRTSSMVVFRNPFDSPLSVTFSLENADRDVFTVCDRAKAYVCTLPSLFFSLF